MKFEAVSPRAPAARTGLGRAASRCAAWTMLALVTYWTLCPLSARPKLAPPELERFGAYFVLGALFALTTSRPRVLAVSLVGVGVGLEFAQLFVPGRDAAVPDAIEKALGALAGISTVVLVKTVALQPSLAAVVHRRGPSRPSTVEE